MREGDKKDKGNGEKEKKERRKKGKKEEQGGGGGRERKGDGGDLRGCGYWCWMQKRWRRRERSDE